MRQSRAIPIVKVAEVVAVFTQETFESNTDFGIVLLGRGGLGLGRTDGSLITSVSKSCLFFVVVSSCFVSVSKLLVCYVLLGMVSVVVEVLQCLFGMGIGGSVVVGHMP